ncbi:MAG: TetR/AcrR family transcriptional regulator [Stagnimonas sp.]|nr:TetR/AcrR family transcriptional regulator [Stagnimonas sp.]
MARDPEPTREKLLRAGEQLAAEHSLGELRVDAITALSGVAKGTFYVHFKTRADYLVALHRRFHDRLAASIDGALARQPPGRARLLAGSLAYLDGCLAEGALKALLLGARVEPDIQQEVARQNARFGKLAAQDLARLHGPEPAQTGRLWVAMVAEAALAEREAGAPLPALRAALAGFLTGFADRD